MPRGRGAKQYFTFVKGWNTEAQPTGFPENSALDLDNVILDIDGSIRRRPGLDFERNFSKYGLARTDTERSTEAIGFFEWTNVGGSGSLTFAITQYGTTLHFHRQNGDATSATSVGTIDMSTFVTNTQEAPLTVVQVASGLGKLFVSGRYINPFYVSYDGSTLTATQVDIEVRDFNGSPTKNFLVDERPKTVDDDHIYDLLNAGWPVDRINTYAEETVLNGNVPNVSVVNLGPVTGAWASRSDIHYLGTKVDSGTGNTVFDIAEFNAQTFGNTPAPAGRFILNAFDKDRAAATGLTNVTNETIDSRPETVAFHNGRVFWAGIAQQGLTGNVYFSQQLTDITKAGKCYQEQDPTAEDFNDLLATDGGLIPIPNAGNIVRMMEGPNGVIVFAGNGIWQITGGEGKFSATDFGVTKITDVGCIGGETVIEADGTFIYWSDAGIIMLQADQITGNLNPVNMTKNTIQKGYLLIGGINRRFARGVFITEEKKAVWLYSSDSNFDGINDRYKLDRVLVLDTQLGAWYKYSIAEASGTAPYAAGIIKTLPYTSGDVTSDVTVGGVTVTVSAVDVTTSAAGFTGDDISAWKILTVIDSDTADHYDFTMSEFYSVSWHDWFKVDGTGINYTSFLETGYELAGNVMLNKSPTYVFTYFAPDLGQYYALPPLVDFSNGYRVTQDVLETLNTIDTAQIRTTQTVLETLNTVADPNLRTTQAVVEVLITQ